MKRESPTVIQSDRLLKSTDAAQLLGVSIRTLWRLKSIGKITAVQLNHATRFRHSDIQRLIANGIEPETK